MQTYDAGLEREWLAETLADWQGGFMALEKAQRFERRLRRLARVMGTSRDQMLQMVRADAEQIHMNYDSNR